MFPKYPRSTWFILNLAVSLLTGRQRSFHRDGSACLEGLKPPLRVIGKQNTPQAGPCLITFNHYYRHGFNAWWMALALAAEVPADIHFVMTGELTFPGKIYTLPASVASRWLLGGIARVYGFTTMPPMPPREKDVAARARSVQKFLTYIHKNPRSILGLAPEGSDNLPDGSLTWPAPGAGRFISLVAGDGFKIVPAGIYEEGGYLCLNFGEAYTLKVPGGIPATERDHVVIEIVMRKIAALLPDRLRGPFEPLA